MLDSKADVRGVLSGGIEPRGLECPWYQSQGSQAIPSTEGRDTELLGDNAAWGQNWE